MSETATAGDKIAEWLLLDDVPYGYQLAGGLFTFAWGLLFFAGPRVPYLFPEDELLHSIGAHPMFIPVYVAMWPMALWAGRHLGGLMWDLWGGDSSE